MPEGTSRGGEPRRKGGDAAEGLPGGEGALEGKSHREEAAPEGSARRRGGASAAAPVTQNATAAQVPRDAALRLAGLAG